MRIKEVIYPFPEDKDISSMVKSLRKKGYCLGLVYSDMGVEQARDFTISELDRESKVTICLSEEDDFPPIGIIEEGQITTLRDWYPKGCKKLERDLDQMSKKDMKKIRKSYEFPTYRGHPSRDIWGIIRSLERWGWRVEIGEPMLRKIVSQSIRFIFPRESDSLVGKIIGRTDRVETIREYSLSECEKLERDLKRMR